MRINVTLSIVVLLIGGWLMLIPLAFGASITNGSFEAVQIGAPFTSSNPADVPGWTHGGSLGDGLLWAVGYSDPNGSITTAGAGNQFVTLGGGVNTPGSANWSTTITGLTPGTLYDLRFMTATEQGPNFPGAVFAQTMTVSFLTGSSTGPRSFTSPISSTDYWRIWATQDDIFLATSTSATVDFSVSNQVDDMGLDNVSIAPATAVPEPSSPLYLLFGPGLLGVVDAVRRKLLG